jgi:hypothetical protein
MIFVENMKVTSVDRSSENIILVSKQKFVWKERWKIKARLRVVPGILCFFPYLTSYKMHNCIVSNERIVVELLQINSNAVHVVLTSYLRVTFE